MLALLIIVPIIALFALNLGSEPPKSNYSFDTDLTQRTIESSVSDSSKFEEFYGNLTPEIKRYFDDMASNVMTPDPKELYDTNYPAFKRVYDNYDYADKRAYDDLPSKLQFTIVTMPELHTGFFEIDPQFQWLIVSLANVHTEIITCDIIESSGKVKIDYSVTNDNPMEHSLAFHVLGVDLFGDVVSESNAHVDIQPMQTLYRTAIIEDHPKLVDCDLRLDVDNSD